jgi:hypothetical protein
MPADDLSLLLPAAHKADPLQGAYALGAGPLHNPFTRLDKAELRPFRATYNHLSDRLAERYGLTPYLPRAFPVCRCAERLMTRALGDCLRLPLHADAQLCIALTQTLLYGAPAAIRDAYAGRALQVIAVDPSGNVSDLVLGAYPGDAPELAAGIPQLVLVETKYLAAYSAPLAKELLNRRPALGLDPVGLFSVDHDLADGRPPRQPHRQGETCWPYHHAGSGNRAVSTIVQLDAYVAFGHVLLERFLLDPVLTDPAAPSIHGVLFDVAQRDVTADLALTADRWSTCPAALMLAVATDQMLRLRRSGPSRALNLVTMLVLRLLGA